MYDACVGSNSTLTGPARAEHSCHSRQTRGQPTQLLFVLNVCHIDVKHDLVPRAFLSLSAACLACAVATGSGQTHTLILAGLQPSGMNSTVRQNSGPLATGKPAGWRGGASSQRPTPSRQAALLETLRGRTALLPAMPRHPDIDWAGAATSRERLFTVFSPASCQPPPPMCAGVGHLPRIASRQRLRRSASSTRPRCRAPGIMIRGSGSTSTGSSSRSDARRTRTTGWPATGSAPWTWIATGWRRSCARRWSTWLKHRSYRCVSLPAHLVPQTPVAEKLLPTCKCKPQTISYQTLALLSGCHLVRKYPILMSRSHDECVTALAGHPDLQRCPAAIVLLRATSRHKQPEQPGAFPAASPH